MNSPLPRIAAFPLVLTFVLLSSVASGEDSPVKKKLEAADSSYTKTVNEAEAVYRKAFSEAIALAAKAEIYLLDFEMAEAEHAARAARDWHLPNGIYSLPDGLFPIVPYNNTSKVLHRKVLTADELKLLMPVLQSTIAIKENAGGAFCHMPIHGLRLWDGDELIFQSSFCHYCGNFYMIYPNGESSWTSMPDLELEKVMKLLMPVPQSEVDRFEVWKKAVREEANGGKKKGAESRSPDPNHIKMFRS